MKSRTESLQIARHTLFDLMVIGGGIAGAGVAQNAASRGLSVVLIEKEDFSSGTSSKTTKLIHGGLRYLEHFRLRLTSQLCRERALLQRLAPHMVRDASFVLPLTKTKPLFNWKMHLGLALYDLVALTSKASHRFESLSVDNTLRAAPALSREGLGGGLRFHDCVTDDCRMVLAVLESACAQGALAINYLQATAFSVDGSSRVHGVECRDRYTGEDLVIRAKACVNATGVWSDEVCKLMDAGWPNRITASKGTHIVVPASAFEVNTALFLPTDDNRYVFVVPWHHALMIGTTDHPYTGSLDHPLPDGAEIDYLLEVVNSYSSGPKLRRTDIVGAFSGLRPLVRMPTAEAQDTKVMSREHFICESPGGLINVSGGKLTSYRLMAEEVVDMAAAKIPDITVQDSRTDQIMLGSWKNKQDFITRSAEISMHARKLDMSPATIEHLIANYGAEAAAVVGLVELDSSLGERICPNFAPIMAEVLYCVQREMAVSLEDVLLRRVRLGVLNQSETLAAAPKVAQFMQRLLDWDKLRVQAELNALAGHFEQHMEPIFLESNS